MSESFEIVPAGQKAFLWLFGSLVLLVLICSMVILIHLRETAALAVTIPVLLFGVLFLGYLLRASHCTTFDLSREWIKVRGDILGRTFRAELLEAQKAKLIDLNKEPGYRPRWKICGTSVPGYQSGRFKLKNGESAWVYLTDESRVVYIPTKKNYAVMMSVTHPERMLEELNRIQPRTSKDAL
jgi:hypothetical protein